MQTNVAVPTIASKVENTQTLENQLSELRENYVRERARFEEFLNQNGDFLGACNYYIENNLGEVAVDEMDKELRENTDLRAAWESINPGIFDLIHRDGLDFEHGVGPGPFLSERRLSDYTRLVGIESIRQGDASNFYRDSNSISLADVEIGAQTIRTFLRHKNNPDLAAFLGVQNLAHEMEHYYAAGNFNLCLPMDKAESESSLIRNSPSYEFIKEWFADIAGNEVGAFRYSKDYTKKRILEVPDAYLLAKTLGGENLNSLSDKLATLMVVSGSDSSKLSIILRNEILELSEKGQKTDEFVEMLDLIDGLICDYTGSKCDQELVDKSHEILSARTDLRRIQFMSVIGNSLVGVAKKVAKERPLLYRYDDASDDDDPRSPSVSYISIIDGKVIKRHS